MRIKSKQLSTGRENLKMSVNKTQFTCWAYSQVHTLKPHSPICKIGNYAFWLLQDMANQFGQGNKIAYIYWLDKKLHCSENLKNRAFYWDIFCSQDLRNTSGDVQTTGIKLYE